MLEKKEIRHLIREEKARFGTSRLKAMSARTIALLEAHPRYQAARTVLLYHSLPDEVATHRLITENYHAKTILLPAVVGKGRMHLRVYQGEGEMKEGAFHIAEPTTPPFTDYGKIDLAVVPGMAFDAEGHRLGRGKGFYDRFLSQPAFHHIHKMGICFPFQFLPHIPTDEYDIAMDEVLCLPREEEATNRLS